MGEKKSKFQRLAPLLPHVHCFFISISIREKDSQKMKRRHLREKGECQGGVERWKGGRMCQRKELKENSLVQEY